MNSRNLEPQRRTEWIDLPNPGEKRRMAYGESAALDRRWPHLRNQYKVEYWSKCLWGLGWGARHAKVKTLAPAPFRCFRLIEKDCAGPMRESIMVRLQN